MSKFVLIIAALAIAVGRFFITPRLGVPTAEGSYEAVSHLFVGGLFGAWLAMRKRWTVHPRPDLLWIPIWLSLLELAMFLLQKKFYVAASMIPTAIATLGLGMLFDTLRCGGGK